MTIGIDARLAFQTGVGRYIRNLLKEFDKHEDNNKYIVFLRKVDEEKIPLGKRFTKVIAGQRWHGLAEQTSFLRLIDSYKLDLMHFTYFSHPVLYKRPFVVTLHDLIIYHHKTGAASTKNPLIYSLKHAAYQYAIKNAAENSRRIIVPTHTVKKDVMHTLKIREEKISVTYEGVDRLPSPKKVDVPKKYFLYVGNAYPHKNVQFALDAFVEFRLKHDEVKLLLVGPDDHFFKKLQLDSHVYALHDVSDAQLAYIYKNALGLIQPSHAEGFGLTPLEAIGQKCPVLVSDIPVFREVLQNHAWYFDPQNKNSLIEKMSDVYNLKKKEKRIDDAKKYSEKYKWEKTARETLQVYERVYKDSSS